MSGQKSRSKSAQREEPLTTEELEFRELTLQQAREAVAAFEKSGILQDIQAGLIPGAVEQIAGIRDFLSTLSPEQQADLTREEVERSRAGGELLDVSIEQELDRIRAGPTGLTPEDEANIGEVFAARRAGIQDFTQDQLEQLREELAPRLGLRSSDTPIIDRGGRIARESIRAAGQLAGEEATARLNFPLQRRGVELQERGFAANLGQSAAATAEGFRQRAFENRLALTGQITQSGLGLATAVNLPAAQAAQRPTVTTTTKERASGGGISSEKFKDLKGPLQTAEVLAAVRGLRLHRYRYNQALKDQDPHVDLEADHVGPTAEDFRDAFGTGDGERIDFLDAIGVLFGAVQALAEEVTDLRHGLVG